jgi:hypothetical protein
VQLRIQDGRVTLSATNATLGDILAEWAKVGRTRIINGERVGGEPLTLQLVDMPEEQALVVLLRSLNGYVAAPRPAPAADASRFDRIMIMPGRAQPRLAAAAPQRPVAQPREAVQAPVEMEPPDLEEQERIRQAQQDDDTRPVRTVPAPATRGSVFNAFPSAPAAAAPATPPANASQPQPPQPAFGMPAPPPGGVPVPGMIVPAPQQQDDRRPPPNY